MRSSRRASFLYIGCAPPLAIFVRDCCVEAGRQYPHHEGGGARFALDRVVKHMGIKRCFQLEICFLMTMRDATARGKRRPAARLSDYAAGEN
jgi:hypothetical protein